MQRTLTRKKKEYSQNRKETSCSFEKIIQRKRVKQISYCFYYEIQITYFASKSTNKYNPGYLTTFCMQFTFTIFHCGASLVWVGVQSRFTYVLYVCMYVCIYLAVTSSPEYQPREWNRDGDGDGHSSTAIERNMHSTVNVKMSQVMRNC